MHLVDIEPILPELKSKAEREGFNSPGDFRSQLILTYYHFNMWALLLADIYQADIYQKECSKYLAYMLLNPEFSPTAFNTICTEEEINIKGDILSKSASNLLRKEALEIFLKARGHENVDLKDSHAFYNSCFDLWFTRFSTFSTIRFASSELKYLSEVLKTKTNPNLTLEFDNNVNPEFSSRQTNLDIIKYLSDALKVNTSIVSLDLASCLDIKHHFTPEELKPLIGVFEKNTTLAHIAFNARDLTEENEKTIDQIETLFYRNKCMFFLKEDGFDLNKVHEWIKNSYFNEVRNRITKQYPYFCDINNDILSDALKRVIEFFKKKTAAEMFALQPLLTDKYVQIRENTPGNVMSFMYINQQVPIEIKMRIANLSQGLPRLFVPQRETDEALEKTLTDPVLYEKSEGPKKK